MKRMTLVAILAVSVFGCKKKAEVDTTGSGSAMGSDMTMGSGSGSGSGSAATGSGSGSAMAGSGSAAMGSDSAAPTGLQVLIVDATNTGKEADLKAAADAAVAKLPADVKAANLELHVQLNEVGKPPKLDCAIDVLVVTSADKNVISKLQGSATVEVAKGKEEGADNDCYEAVLEDLITKKVPNALADHNKAGSAAPAAGSGSAGSAAGSAAAPAKKK
jgi:hypothetical protein